MPKKLNLDDFINRSIKHHGYKYDYSKVNYKNKDSKVIIICPEHGQFEQNANNHMRGKGCAKCKPNYKLTQKEFIEKSILVHGDYYDYSKVVYVRNKDKVIIICPKHGEFEQEANSHLQGVGCKKCGIERKSSTYMIRYGVDHYNKTDDFKLKIKRTCLKKYGVDNPVKVEHFKQKMFNSKFKNKSFNSSEPEDSLYKLLIDKFGDCDIKRQYRSDKYPFLCDFYIKSLDLYIELNAFWTHGGHYYNINDEQDVNLAKSWLMKSQTSSFYKKAYYVWTVSDLVKRDFAIENGINYLVFWDNNLLDAKSWLNSL